MRGKWKHDNRFCKRKVRDWRSHLNWKSTSHGEDTEKLWDKNRKRTIVVKFLNFEVKSRILHTYREKKLWKKNMFVNEDFSKETASIREGLLQKAKDVRSQNKIAKVAHDKLTVYEKERRNDISEAQGDP